MIELEPLNPDYDEAAVQRAVAEGLERFYQSLTAGLDGIDIKKILRRKDPYLYRAKGVNSASQLVAGILSAYISSSEETIFGNVFFEPLALAVSGGQKAVTEGVDITVDKDGAIYSIAVKSGPSVFNADSRKRQEQNFQAAGRRAQQARRAFIPVVGYGYGKKRIRPGQEKFYRELAGQDFWTWLTGDETFYVKIIRFMGAGPEEYAQRFEDAYDRAENRLIREFTAGFCRDDGSIDWDELIRFNSGGRA